MDVYEMRGVTAKAATNGMVEVRDADGELVALTRSVKDAAMRFVDALKGTK